MWDGGGGGEGNTMINQMSDMVILGKLLDGI